MILLLALLASVQSSASNRFPEDLDCQKYGDGSTMAMSECFKTQSDTWERRLNTEVLAAIGRDEVKASTLKQAQEAWTRYRDANCEVYSTVKGSIHTILVGRCWRDMTRARTLELQDMSWTG